MRMGVIYKITNTVTKKAYVGQTSTSLRQRWREHQSDARSKIRSHPYLHHAIRKYGPESFTIEVIDSALLKEDLDAKEQEWIVRLCTMDKQYGYNCTGGGGACVHGPNSRAKIKGVKRDPEAVEKQRATLLAKHFKLDPERKEKLRLTRVGYKARPETIEKMRTMQQHLWTPERRAMWSQKMRDKAAAEKERRAGQKNPNVSASTKRMWEKFRESGRATELGKENSERQRAAWSDPAKRESERLKWTDERRAAARKKSEEFFASPQGIAARKKISESLRKRHGLRVMTPELHEKSSSAVRRGWINRKLRLQEAA